MTRPHLVMSIDDFKAKIADPAQAGAPIIKGAWAAFLGLFVKAAGPWLEVPESHALDFIAKGASHRYFKRVPTGNPKRPYRYFYNVGGGGGIANHAHFVQGASFKTAGGHHHITEDHGSHVTIRHDETGHTERVSKDELGARIHADHHAAITDHHDRMNPDPAPAVHPHVAELDAKIAAAQKRADRAGGKVSGPTQMGDSFPLGPGSGNAQTRRSQARSIESTITAAKDHIAATDEVRRLTARRANFIAGRVNEQGRTIAAPKAPTRSLPDDTKARMAVVRKFRQDFRMEGVATLPDGAVIRYDFPGEKVTLTRPDGTTKSTPAPGYGRQDDIATALAKEHLAKGTTMDFWIDLDPAFGEQLWASGMAKAMPVEDDGEEQCMALPSSFGEGPWGLFKASKPTKYVKRWKGAGGKWRYSYHVSSGGGVANHAHMTAGSSFQHGNGHYQIHGTNNGKLQVSHTSDPGAVHEMTHGELADKLMAHHAGALKAHAEETHAKLKSIAEQAKQFGTGKQVARAQKVLDQHEQAHGLGAHAPKSEPEPDFSGGAPAGTGIPIKKPGGPSYDPDWRSKLKYNRGSEAPRAEEKPKAAEPAKPSAEADTGTLPESVTKRIAELGKTQAAMHEGRKWHGLAGVDELHSRLKPADKTAVEDLRAIAKKKGPATEAAVEAALKEHGVRPFSEMTSDAMRKREDEGRQSEHARVATLTPDAKKDEGEAKTPKSASDHLSDAKTRYNLTDAEHKQVVSRASEGLKTHLDNSDHEKAAAHVRHYATEAVARNPDRNVSHKGAEKYIASQEKKHAVKKAWTRVLSAWGSGELDPTAKAMGWSEVLAAWG